MPLDLALTITGNDKGGEAVLDRTAEGMRKIGVAAQDTAERASQAADRTTAAFKKSGLQTANLAAQIQDVVVQMQAGQNPLQIALQQGTQINQVIGQAGAKGAVAALGEAFTSLINPVSIATIAIIGLGGAAIQYFSHMSGGAAADAEKTLERQKDLIKEIGDAWPAAGKGLKDYLDKAHDITPNALLVRSQQQIDAAKAQLASLTTQIVNMTSNTGGGRSGPTNPLAFQPELLAQIRDMVREYQAGITSASVLGDKLASLELDPNLPASVKAIIDLFIDVSSKISDADATAKAFSSTLEAIRAQGGLIIGGDFDQLEGSTDLVAKLRAMAPDLRTASQKAIDTYNQNSGLDADGSGKKQLDYTLSQIAAQKAQEQSQQAAKEAASKAKAQAEAVDNVTKSLRDQTAALTETNREQFIAQQLSAAHVAKLSDEGKAISEDAGKLYDLKAALDASNKAATFLGDSIGGALIGIADGSEDAAGALRSLVKTLEDAVLQAALLGEGPLAGILGTAPQTSGGLGGVLGSFVSSLFTPAAPSFAPGAGFTALGHNAAGTNNWRGGLTWVGEQGPEVVDLPAGSKVYPAGQSAAMTRGGDTNVFNISTPTPRAFAESPSRLARGAARLVVQARRHT